jgi:quinol monooxygenase YgiN
MPIIVFASFVPKPGSEDQVEKLLRGMVTPTRAELGNVRYDLYRTNTGEDSFHFFEIYEDQAALEAHRATVHYKAYRASITDYLAEPIGVKVLTGLDVAA